MIDIFKDALIAAICLMAAGYCHSDSLDRKVRDPAFLHEVMHYLYRWHLDEHDIEAALPLETIQIWLNDVTPDDLDQDDRSRIIKIGIPVFDLRLLLKKTDYHIQELDISVQSDSFKIIEVLRCTVGSFKPDGALVLELNTDDIREYVFRMRTRRKAFDPDLNEHLCAMIIRQADIMGSKSATHEVYIAPPSPMANELWIFWKTERRLIRVASDIAITDPAVWQHEHMSVRVFNIEQQMILSLAEMPGSNAFMTRDQVGRVLYNCIVLGEHRIIDKDNNG